MKLKVNLKFLSGFVLILIIVSVGFWHYTFGKIPVLFKLNAELKAEAYYTGDFEFKMVGLIYYIDHGEYYKAFRGVNHLYHQMKSRKDLIKVPSFSSKSEELEFYLSLQNPTTGAFMDESYPLCTFIGPTMNVLSHLEMLAKESGRKLKLRYPLGFLDEINTPEKLEAFLDDLSMVGWLVSKLPQTPYVIIFELNDYQDIERTGAYMFSDAWKHALLNWFYKRQDSETGFWGPVSKTDGRILKSGDMNSTYHIAKMFIDDSGNNKHNEYQLKYKDKMFKTLMTKLSEPIPGNSASQHDWSISRYRALRLLIKKIVPTCQPEQKVLAREVIQNSLEVVFSRFYVKKDGAFSLYPDSLDADLDGTGECVSLLMNIGALSFSVQEALWGVSKTIIDKGSFIFSNVDEGLLNSIQEPGVNSIRIYTKDPFTGGYTTNLKSILYPAITDTPDIIEVIAGIDIWLLNTPQKMGNWISKEFLEDVLPTIKIMPENILNEKLTVDILKYFLKSSNQITIVSFDKMQIPQKIIRVKMK